MISKIKKHKGENIFGISTEFIKNPATFMLAHEKKLGNIFKITLPIKNDFILTSDADFVEYISLKNEKNYPKSKIHWKAMRKLLGKAVATTEGEEWKYHKQILQPSFNKSALEPFLKLNEQIFRSHLEHFKSLNYPVDFINELVVVVIEVMLKAVLGVSTTIDYQHFAKILTESKSILMWRAKFPWRSITGWFNGKNFKLYKYIKEFDDFAERVIEKTNPSNDSAIGRLLIEYYNTKGITKKEIRNEIILNIGAGNDIFATIISLALVALKQNPKNYENIQLEIEQLIGTNPITYLSVDKLKFTTQFVQETIRYYSPSYSIIRDCNVDDIYKNYSIKSGDTIFVSIFAIHHSEKYWDVPMEFLPERFEEENNRHKFAFMPFGAGKHSCIAKYLAIPQLVWTLAFFVQNFDFEVVDINNLEFKAEILYKPKNVFIKLINRKTSKI